MGGYAFTPAREDHDDGGGRPIPADHWRKSAEYRRPADPAVYAVTTGARRYLLGVAPNAALNARLSAASDP